jgi:hypothetical protein
MITSAQWNRGSHHRASPALRFNRQFPPYRSHAFAHADDPKAGYLAGRPESNAVVVDREIQAPSAPLQRYGNVPRPRVLRCVAQPFLRHTVKRKLEFLADLVARPESGEAYGEGAAILKIGAQSPQRRLQARLLQNSGV